MAMVYVVDQNHDDDDLLVYDSAKHTCTERAGASETILLRHGATSHVVHHLRITMHAKKS